MEGRPSRLPLYLGIVLAVCGWAAIGVAWYQAGRQGLETGQIPFLISGGFGGWGLLLMGGVAILVDTIRQASWRETAARRVQDRQLATIRRDLEHLAGTSDAERPRRRPRRRAADG